MRATSVLLELSSSNNRKIGVDETVLNDSRNGKCLLRNPLRRNLPAAISARDLAEVMDCYFPELNFGQNAQAIPPETLCLVSFTL